REVHLWHTPPGVLARTPHEQTGRRHKAPAFFSGGRRKEEERHCHSVRLSLFLLSPSSFLLTFEQEVPWILDVLLDPDEELHRLTPVDNAVVVAERHIHHRADGDLTVERHGAILDLVEAQYAHLRRVQDWRAEE